MVWRISWKFCIFLIKIERSTCNVIFDHLKKNIIPTGLVTISITLVNKGKRMLKSLCSETRFSVHCPLSINDYVIDKDRWLGDY